MRLWIARYAVPMPTGSPQVMQEDFYLPSANDVRRFLRQRGFHPIEIKERKPPLFEWFEVRSQKWALQLLRALRFQTATASAGTALLNIIENENDSRRRVAFLPTRTVLKAGGSFADALAQLRLLDAPTLAIIIAGEKAGDLKGVIPHAIQHIEEKGRQMRVIFTALGWVVFDIISVVGTVVSAQFQFIPYLKEKGIESSDPEAIEKFNTALARAEAINLSIMFISLAFCIIFAAGIYSYLRNRDKPDHWLNRMMVRLPLFSSYLQNTSLADTGQLMARLLRGHVPLDDALKILETSTLDPTVLDYWRRVRRKLMSGSPPMRALAQPPLTKAEQDQVSTVQESQQVAEVFESIAEERKLMSKDSQRKIFLLGIFLLMLIFGAVTLTMIYLVMIQNQGFMDSLSQLRQGV